jgi:hypothetical protein
MHMHAVVVVVNERRGQFMGIDHTSQRPSNVSGQFGSYTFVWAELEES